MTSLPKPERGQPTQPVLVADAGLPYRQPPADPITAWLDLIETIELLHPVNQLAVRKHQAGETYLL